MSEISEMSEMTPAEYERRALMAKNAPILGKWLPVLFWVTLVSYVSTIVMNMFTRLISDNSNFNFFLGVFLVVIVLNTVLYIFNAVVLFKLSPVQSRYRTAGIFTLIYIVSTFLIAAGLIYLRFSILLIFPTWLLLIALFALIVFVLIAFFEFHAHSAVLVGIDDALSKKWKKLCGWYIGLNFGVLLALIVVVVELYINVYGGLRSTSLPAFFPVIAVILTILLLGAGFGIIFVSILRLVYLSSMVKIFREYSSDKPSDNPMEIN